MPILCRVINPQDTDRLDLILINDQVITKFLENCTAQACSSEALVVQEWIGLRPKTNIFNCLNKSANEIASLSRAILRDECCDL